MIWNVFAALEDECDDGNTVKPSLSTGKTLVVGDSQVRAFSARVRKIRTLGCLLGLGIMAIGNRNLAGNGAAPTVSVSADGNNIGRVRRQKLLRKYRDGLGKVRDHGSISCVCGILPCRSAGISWWSEQLAG